MGSMDGVLDVVGLVRLSAVGLEIRLNLWCLFSGCFLVTVSGVRPPEQLLFYACTNFERIEFIYSYRFETGPIENRNFEQKRYNNY